MPATTSNLDIEQGSDWSRGWLVKYQGTPIDATWTATGQIRPKVKSATLLHQFAATVNPDGSVVIAVAATDSAAWAWCNAVYDVKVANQGSSVILRVAEGRVNVSPQVTLP